MFSFSLFCFIIERPGAGSGSGSYLVQSDPDPDPQHSFRQTRTVSMGMFLETELTQVTIELPTLSLTIAAESPPCRTLNNN
jgi:hypothetical protein